MKAITFHDIENLAFESSPDPELVEPTDVIVRVAVAGQHQGGGAGTRGDHCVAHTDGSDPVDKAETPIQVLSAAR